MDGDIRGLNGNGKNIMKIIYLKKKKKKINKKYQKYTHKVVFCSPYSGFMLENRF